MTPSERRRYVTAATWILAGAMHFVLPKSYEAIVPPPLAHYKSEVVLLSGLAELAGGVGVLSPHSRRGARWFLLATLAAVFPANIYMATNSERFTNIPRALLWARLPLQGVFGALTWRGTR
ncbi:MAG: DoxX family protein [Actinomycetota bacterium]